MSEAINLENHRREVARWQILLILDAGRPFGVNTPVILRILQDAEDVHADFTLEGLHRELDYLRGLGLVETGEHFEYGKLTPEGVAVVEYNASSPAGIARPRQSGGVR